MIMFQKKFTFAISMFALCLVGVNYSALAQEVEDPRAPYVAINDDDATGIAAVSLVNQLVDTAGMAANFAANAAADADVAAAAAAASAQEAKTALNTKVKNNWGTAEANKALTIDATGLVTSNKIATDNIADQAVTSAKIANNTITSDKIADNTITNADIKTDANIAASKISGLATVATSGSYNDLANLPTVHSNSLTIQNGATGDDMVKFTANSTDSKTVRIPAATPSTAGLAKIGVIPNGSPTSTTYATIWVQ